MFKIVVYPIMMIWLWLALLGSSIEKQASIGNMPETGGGLPLPSISYEGNPYQYSQTITVFLTRIEEDVTCQICHLHK